MLKAYLPGASAKEKSHQLSPMLKITDKFAGQRDVQRNCMKQCRSVK